MSRCNEGAHDNVRQSIPGGAMELGAQSVFDGQGASVPDAALTLAWFERSSIEQSALPGKTPVEGGGGLLDRVREGEGLVYNGEGEYES